VTIKVEGDDREPERPRAEKPVVEEAEKPKRRIYRIDPNDKRNDEEIIAANALIERGRV
jgi:methyl coenzyme M reductase gamma subunit